MNREQKQDLVSSLNTLLQDQTFVAVTHYKGLSVAEMEDLRGKAREAGAGFRVTKNRLTRLALTGTKFEGLSESVYRSYGNCLFRGSGRSRESLREFCQG